jgi:cytochrome b561
MSRLITTLLHWASGFLVVFALLLVMAEAEDRDARQTVQR